MFNISQFLQRFKHIEGTERETRVFITSALKEVLNIEIPIEKVTYRNSIATIKVDGAIKSEIFIKKPKLLAILQQKIPTIVDIKCS